MRGEFDLDTVSKIETIYFLTLFLGILLDQACLWIESMQDIEKFVLLTCAQWVRAFTKDTIQMLHIVEGNSWYRDKRALLFKYKMMSSISAYV